MALNMGTFEALDYREMMNVEGGGPFGWMLAGFAVDGVVKAATGRYVGEWFAYAIEETPPKTPPIKNYRHR